MTLDVVTEHEMGPPRIVLYGTEGVGKTTLGASIPNSVFILTEDGLGTLSAPHFPVRKTLHQVEADLGSLAQEKHDYEYVVVDTITTVERLIHDEVNQQSGQSMKTLDSFGLREKMALPVWRRVLGRIDALRERGMMVVLIGHARIDRISDPLAGEYDRFSPRLTTTRTGDSSALLTEWADAVLFASHRIRVEEGKAAPVGAGGGERIVRTTGGPACVAKNRYSMPEVLPLSWAAIIEAIAPAEPAKAKPVSAKEGKARTKFLREAAKSNKKEAARV